MEQFFGCVFIFSGRPDPTWQLKKEQVSIAESIWDELKPSDSHSSFTPQLGYRGCSFMCEDIEYKAYKGIVIKKFANTSEHRKDDTRRFERFLLSTAPKGLFPDIDIQEK